jgi:hypothetical protein
MGASTFSGGTVQAFSRAHSAALATNELICTGMLKQLVTMPFTLMQQLIHLNLITISQSATRGTAAFRRDGWQNDQHD